MDRLYKNTWTGKTSCLTLGSKQWLRKRGRVLSGCERMSLQGVCPIKYKDGMSSCPEKDLWMLSGNAVNFYNMCQGLLAAWSVLDIPWTGDR